jgi:hypothetical protein
MADVEMRDAPAKSSKGGSSTEVADGKKRFEVKKVTLIIT